MPLGLPILIPTLREIWIEMQIVGAISVKLLLSLSQLSRIPHFFFFSSQGMPSDLSSPGSSLHLLQQATSLAAFNALHDKFDTYSNSSSEGGRGSPPSKYLSEPATPSPYGTPGFHFKFSPGRFMLTIPQVAFISVWRNLLTDFQVTAYELSVKLAQYQTSSVTSGLVMDVVGSSQQIPTVCFIETVEQILFVLFVQNTYLLYFPCPQNQNIKSVKYFSSV